MKKTRKIQQRRNDERCFDLKIVSEWTDYFDRVYHDDSESERVGWDSSYTGKRLGESDMDEWIEQTIARIRSFTPQRLVEIGVGTGMLLHRLIPFCAHYLGCDPSHSVIASHQQYFDACGLRHVQVVTCGAHELDDVHLRDVDTVVINSVIQYFPNTDYLEDVLKILLEHMTEGTIFIGDVRDHSLQDEFYISIERQQQGKAFTKCQASELRHVLDIKRRVETELMIAPAWFDKLPAKYDSIASVAILPKAGVADNEMNRFRYDVVLQIGKSGEQARIREVSWQPGWSLSDESGEFVLKGYPNRRVWVECQVVNAIREQRYDPDALRAWVQAEQALASYHQLIAQAESQQYSVEIQIGVDGREYDLLFTHKPSQIGAYDRRAVSRDGQDTLATTPRLSVIRKARLARAMYPRQ
ncbi:class I SAM-dependent methyltransferase (plasmid) [Vibrio lentus]|nr:class I SAM-dependent methyltransferase [Vibrio lentus]PMI54078.1 hypothetical protein BCU43_17655 [Vibrio lentus]